MANNVRCAGGGSPRRKTVAPAPCGWKGHRKLYWLQVSDDLGVQKQAPDTGKPCPSCGGRVELIERVSA
jgi:hypothetical protein